MEGAEGLLGGSINKMVTTAPAVKRGDDRRPLLLRRGRHLKLVVSESFADLQQKPADQNKKHKQNTTR